MDQKEFLQKLRRALDDLKANTTHSYGVDYKNMHEASNEIDRRLEKLLNEERVASESMAESDMWPELGRI